MSAETLITNHLDLWTEAITKKSSSGRGSNGKIELTGVKKLRELILELAVRGKLVDQSQEDEPSSELLKKIFAENNKRIERGEIKKPKNLPSIDGAELPFQIPASWKFIRLGDAVDIIRGITFPASEKSNSPAPERLACLRTTNVQDTIEVRDLLYIKESFVTKNSQYIQKNDIVMSMANSRELVGKVAFVEEQPDEPMTFGGFLGVLRPTLLHPKFLMAVLRAPHSRETLIGNASQTTNIANISIGKLNPLVIGLPPLEEQHRIVQKVDELMALCDRLEQQTSDQMAAHDTLVDTLLGTLTQSQNATELAENWTRLAAHFDILFSTEQSIDKLKQTILQLAVMGRLVDQYKNSGSISQLLSTMEEQKNEQVKSKVIRKPKPAPPVSEDEKGFLIPDNWTWVKFGQTGAFINGDRSKNYPNKEDYVQDGVPWINTGHIKPDGTLTKTGMYFIAREKYESLRSGKIEPTDLVYCLRGATFGKTAFVTPYKEGAIASSLMIIRPYIPEMRGYIYNYLISPFGRSQIFRFDNGSAQPNLSANSVTMFAFPLPPLEEQHRINQKVDELFDLCDRLKSNLRKVGITRYQLAESIVENALQ